MGQKDDKKQESREQEAEGQTSWGSDRRECMRQHIIALKRAKGLLAGFRARVRVPLKGREVESRDEHPKGEIERGDKNKRQIQTTDTRGREREREREMI